MKTCVFCCYYNLSTKQNLPVDTRRRFNIYNTSIRRREGQFKVLFCLHSLFYVDPYLQNNGCQGWLPLKYDKTHVNSRSLNYLISYILTYFSQKKPPLFSRVGDFLHGQCEKNISKYRVYSILLSEQLIFVNITNFWKIFLRQKNKDFVNQQNLLLLNFLCFPISWIQTEP